MSSDLHFPFMSNRVVLLGLIHLAVVAGLVSNDVDAAEKLTGQIDLPKEMQHVSSVLFSPDDQLLILGGCPSLDTEPEDSVTKLYKRGRIATFDIAKKRFSGTAETGSVPTGIHAFAGGDNFVIQCLGGFNGGGGDVALYSPRKRSVRRLSDITTLDIALCARTSEAVGSPGTVFRQKRDLRLWLVDPANATVTEVAAIENEFNTRCAPVAISTDGKTLAVGVGDGPKEADGTALRVFRRDQPNKNLVDARYRHCIGPLKFTDDGSRLAVGDASGGIEMWSVDTGKKIWTLPSPDQEKSGFSTLSFSSDRQSLAVSTWERVLVIDVGSGKLIHEIPFMSSTVAGFSNRDNLLATAGRRDESASKIELWEIPSRSEP
jgi:WD40 repeat protein